MTSVEENGTAHDQTTEPDVDWKVAGNDSIFVQQLKREIENMKSKFDEHLGNSLSFILAIIAHSTFQSSTRLITSNDCSFGWPIIRMDTIHNAILSITTPRMIDTTKVIV